VTLDVSNNKLQTLPYNMWKAPKLKELNAAFNLLRELPTNPPEVSQWLNWCIERVSASQQSLPCSQVLDLRLKACFQHFILTLFTHKKYLIVVS